MRLGFYIAQFVSPTFLRAATPTAGARGDLGRIASYILTEADLQLRPKLRGGVFGGTTGYRKQWQCTS